MGEEIPRLCQPHPGCLSSTYMISQRFPAGGLTILRKMRKMPKEEDFTAYILLSPSPEPSSFPNLALRFAWRAFHVKALIVSNKIAKRSRQQDPREWLTVHRQFFMSQNDFFD